MTTFNAKFRKVYKEDVSLGESTEFVTGNDGNIVEVNQLNGSHIPIINQAYDYIVDENSQLMYENNISDVLLYVDNKINDINLADTDNEISLTEETKNAVFIKNIETQKDFNIQISQAVYSALSANSTNNNGVYYYIVDTSSGNVTYNLNQSNYKNNSDIILIGTNHNSSYTTRINLYLETGKNVSQKIKFYTCGMGGWISSESPKIYFYLDNVEYEMQLSHKPYNTDKVLYRDIGTYTIGSTVFQEKIEVVHYDDSEFLINILH